MDPWCTGPRHKKKTSFPLCNLRPPQRRETSRLAQNGSLPARREHGGIPSIGPREKPPASTVVAWPVPSIEAVFRGEL